MSITDLFIRLLIAFITLLVLTRIIGRKEISQMTYFNFISAISIGTIGASLAVDSSLGIRNGLIALVAWSIFTILLGFMSIKSKPMRNAVVGQPVIIIDKGNIVQEALQKSRLDLNSLNGLLRKKDVFSIKDVEYALFETDGSLSVLKKESNQPVTKNEMNIKPTNNGIYPIAFAIISDGNYNEENLEKFNVSKQTLQQDLKTVGITSISDVFYAEMQKDGSMYVAEKNSENGMMTQPKGTSG